MSRVLVLGGAIIAAVIWGLVLSGGRLSGGSGSGRIEVIEPGRLTVIHSVGVPEVEPPTGLIYRIDRTWQDNGWASAMVTVINATPVDLNWISGHCTFSLGDRAMRNGPLVITGVPAGATASEEVRAQLEAGQWDSVSCRMQGRP